MADITFGTNNEYGFDYLRDNMASSPKDLVQRKHHYAIVDEVDSVLIDDARTPLIISGPVPKGDDQLFEQYRPAIEHLYNLQKNLVTNLLAESRQLLGEGKNEEGGIKLYRSHKGLPKYKPLIKFLSEQGIKAQMQKTENIYMQDNNRRHRGPHRRDREGGDYSGGKGPEARCRNQRLRRQSRARAYGHPVAESIRDVRERCRTVSYTHLTLPTNREV